MGRDGKLHPSLVASGVELHSIPGLDIYYVGINMHVKTLGGNRKLRQALNAAFDAKEWEKYYSNRVLPADSPVPPGVDGRIETPFAYSFDLEKAKRLMAEAGYPGGIDPATGRRLVLTLSFGRASQFTREMGELIASFYERIGVKLELDFQTWSAFLKSVCEGRVQLFHMGWVGDYPDAENFLQLFHSRNLSPGPNHANYANEEFDRLYDAALAAATAEERNGYWLRCQEIIREDCPWIFTHFSKSNSLVRPTVGNYIPSNFPYGQECYYEAKGAQK
jgi:ABC-type transport system substrate-binding protein